MARTATAGARARVPGAPGPIGGPALVVALALLGACRADATRRPASERAGAEAAPADRAQIDGEARPDADADVDDRSGEAPEAEPRPPYTPPSTLGEPIEIRQAKRTRTVYAAPDHDSPLRGRIPRKDSFFLYERREAGGCDEPWGKVASGGWVCLERTTASEEQPRTLPELMKGELLPFLYARHEAHDDPSTPAIPVYAGLRAFNRGDPPVETIPAYGSYAFIRELRNRGRPVYVTQSRRVVAKEDLELFKPSEFAGRSLDQGPIPAGRTLAWAVRWKTLIHAAADPEAEQLDRVPYHDTLYVVGEGVEGADGERWFEVPDDPEHPDRAAGWIREHDLRRFVPEPPPEPVLAGQITVDVDLDEQVLSVWREEQAIFVTLISSGKRGDSTPPGLYRIETKWAYGKMASLPSAEDPYYVDAVPWAMYFDGRYALHASYWHDLFGHRMSHGCVNLSPRDAKRVFELVTPSLPPGWLLVHEHATDPGALVRVRKGERSLPDHRQPLAPPDDSASG